MSAAYNPFNSAPDAKGQIGEILGGTLNAGVQSGFNPYAMGAAALMGIGKKVGQDRQAIKAQTEFLQNQDFSIGVDSDGRPLFGGISADLQNMQGIEGDKIGKGMWVSGSKKHKARSEYERATQRANTAIMEYGDEAQTHMANKAQMINFQNKISGRERLKNLYNIPSI